MRLSSRPPTSLERLQRLAYAGIVQSLTPLVRIGGRPMLRRWLARRMHEPTDAAACFLMPLSLAEAALGSLPEYSCRVSDIHTILAEWVDCDGRMRNCLDYFLGSGEWTPLVRSTDGDPVREEARQIIAADLSYRQTEVYGSLVQAALAGMPQRRQGRQLNSVADVDRYFVRFVRLFRSILTHGVLPNRKLERAGVRFNQDRGMGIVIDVDGRLHRLQGANHRWAIAQVLEIPEVPAEIRLIHVGSCTGLDELFRTGSR